MVDIREHDLQQFVGDDRTAISKAKQGMISEDSFHAQSTGMEDALMTECTECLHGVWEEG